MPYGLSLCSLQTSDIVVTFKKDQKVVVYSRNGEIRQTLNHIKFRYPMAISVNKVNRDIYIADKEKNDLESRGKVIAARAHCKLRYAYSGQGDSLFTPSNVCTDRMGYVFVNDYCNYRVHFLDQVGRFIRYILTTGYGLGWPFSINVDSEGYVWVGESGLVTVARYIQ